MIVSFKFRTEPQLSYVGEGYQRGPVHTGMVDMIIRGYVWTNEHIKNYVRLRQEEDLELLSAIDESGNEALKSLGSELYEYIGLLEEAKPMEMPKAKQPFFDEFKAVWDGMKEMFGALSPGSLNIFKPAGEDALALQSEMDAADAELRYIQYQIYKNYKKAHDMLQW